MTINRILRIGLFAAIAVMSIVTLAKHPQVSPDSMYRIDQSRYAEIATTSAEEAPVGAATSSVSLPILVYHIVRPAYPDDSAAVRRLALTPEAFDAELGHLASAGYHVIAFDDLERYFAGHASLPDKPVIISFDDGWKDQFIYAYPILVKHGYAATFFVFTNAIGRRGFISWSDLETMRAAGMTIGSHSRSHPYLTRTATSSLEAEITGSKRVLEEHLGTSVNEFAYPFGNYDPAIVALVKQAGYRSARGDFYSGDQSASRLYELSALNAPTTIEAFKNRFTSSGYRNFPR